ncbi:MAG: response regulator [Rhizobiales bacterium]|nr:response regulator [Hyphomicrobiales bacterium]NRB12965.1 response regulator [Hyphomicrobiales bacterium]
MTKHNALFMSLDELNILILEDNLSMVKIYKNILNSFGVKQISFATSVDEAKELVRMEQPDLIICDFILNGNDKYNNGLAFLRWIRQVDMAPACFTPVLMSTGHASRRIVLEFNKYGASSIVVKPLSPIILKQRIENILIDTRALIVEAGRVVIEGAVKYTKPKTQDKLVYDPGFLSRLVKNDVKKFNRKNPSNSLKIQNDDDFFAVEFNTQTMFD